LASAASNRFKHFFAFSTSESLNIKNVKKCFSEEKKATTCTAALQEDSTEIFVSILIERFFSVP